MRKIETRNLVRNKFNISSLVKNYTVINSLFDSFSGILQYCDVKGYKNIRFNHHEINLASRYS